jgi:hypothetical protein
MHYALSPVRMSVADIFFFSFGRYDPSENACHVDLKEPEFVRRHFLSLWGPVQVDAAGKGPRDRQTLVYLIVDCRTPLFSLRWHCRVVKCTVKERVTHTTGVTF